MTDRKFATMIDIVYTKTTKHLFGSPTYETFMQRDWQVYPFYDLSQGFAKYKDTVRVLMYNAEVNGTSADKYRIQGGKVVHTSWVLTSGTKGNAKVGGQFCGCTEMSMYNNPPGLRGKTSRCYWSTTSLHEMRVFAFHDKLMRATDHTLHHRSIVPVIYADAKIAGVPTLRVWTPNKGFIEVVRSPIPFCVTPYENFIINTMSVAESDLTLVWYSMCERWMKENKATTLYLGYDFASSGTPKDDKIDHLVSLKEFDNDATATRLKHIADYVTGDPLADVDIGRFAALTALKNGRFNSLNAGGGTTILGGIEL